MRPLADETGATAVVVGLVMVMLVGFAAYAVDAGQLWEGRRHVVVATDAAALAAAQEEALGGDGCDLAPTYVSNNDADATMTDCATGTAGAGGWVRVDAEAPVGFAFAGIFGLDSDDVFSSTTAEYNSPTLASNLRPYGLCMNVPELAWVGSGNIPSLPATFTFVEGTGGACGEAAGNWGGLAMAGDGSGQAECFDNNSFGDCVQNGTGLPISIGEDIGGTPGANLCNSRQVRDGIQYLIDEGIEIGLPLYDEVTGGGGATSSFHISGFVGVVVTDFVRVGNSCALTVEFRRLVTEGDWAIGESGPLTGVFSVRICDVDSTEGECLS